MPESVVTYLYQFGLGGLVYLGTAALLLRAGALGRDRARRRRWILVLAGVFGLYALGLGLLQFLGPQTRLGAPSGTAVRARAPAPAPGSGPVPSTPRRAAGGRR